MSAPARKAAAWFDALGMEKAPSELQLRAMIRDAKALLEGASAGEAALLHAVLSLAYWRCKNAESALWHAQQASGLEPQSVTHCNQMAAALLELDRADEAIGVLLAGLKLPVISHSNVVLYGNLAEAFARCGDAEAAADCMARAASFAIVDSERDQIALANQYAEIGETPLAFEHIARYLSAARGQEVSPESAWQGQLSNHERAVLTSHKALSALLRDVHAFGIRSGHARVNRGRDGADAAALFEEMRGTIGRANGEVLA